MKWALLVIDLQRDLCWAERRREAVTAALPRVLRLIKLFSRHEAPIFYTKFELEEGDAQFKRFGDTYCIRGTPGCELIQELFPLEGIIVTKSKHSAFFETTLERQLRERDIEGLVLSGLQTQICVLTTAADAYHRGFEVIVAEDAVISTHDDVRLEAVEWIEKYVGRAESVDDIEGWYES